LPTQDLPGIRSYPHSEATHRVPADVILSGIESVAGRDHRQRRLLIYIHVPFCSSKCTFCTWVAGIPVAQLRSSDDTRAHYANAVKEQIEFYAPRLTALGYVPEIVYWGGGTPSLLSAAQISLIANALRENFDLSAVGEYSVESSPETLTAEKISAFQAAGMNRISIGVQSFDESELRRAARSHSAAEAADSLERAKSQGCMNRNIDLITGFPRQTRKVLEETLAKALVLQPEHITAYSYRAAEETTMARQIARGSLPTLHDEDQAAAQDLTYEMLTANGYGEYMTMYYSKSKQHRFRGELYYFDWEGDHIGFGSGANSILATHRIMTARGNLGEYISSPIACDRFYKAGPAKAVHESVTQMFMNGRPIAYDRFFDRFGFDFHDLLEAPPMKAFRVALDRIEAPLVLTPTEAYASAPAGGWHGGEQVRFQTKVRAVIASSQQAASTNA
jgi:putative oxygen-independent coproporphyrinogen III oxidase